MTHPLMKAIKTAWLVRRDEIHTDAVHRDDIVHGEEPGAVRSIPCMFCSDGSLEREVDFCSICGR